MERSIGYSDHVAKATSVKLVVNCSAGYGKSQWKLYSLEQRVETIEFSFQNQCSVRKPFRTLRDFILAIIWRLVVKFESIGSINNQPTLLR